MPTPLSRRTTLAAALLALPPLARAQSERADVASDQISVGGGTVAIVYAKPPGSGPFPTVLVAENGTGLDRVVTDACGKLAKEGFFAVAPALFAGDTSDSAVMQRLDASAAWAAQGGGDAARLAIVGFGPGGRAAWLYDAHSPNLKAAVAWSGPMQGQTTPAQPSTALDAASQLHAPLLGLYGKNEGIPQRILLEAEAKAKQAGKTADIVSYIGAGSNFAVPGSPSFDLAASLDGWIRTLAWLRAHVVAQAAR